MLSVADANLGSAFEYKKEFIYVYVYECQVFKYCAENASKYGDLKLIQRENNLFSFDF